MHWHEITRTGLTEAPIARHGDWSYDPGIIGEFSKVVADRYWRKVDTITFPNNPIRYDLLRHNTENAWKVGNLVTKERNRTHELVQVYDIVFFINLRNEKALGHRLKYPRLHRSYAAGASRELIGSGIAKTMLRYFLEKLRYTIICDYQQYIGARRLWSSLSNDPAFAVDIVNVWTDTIVARNASIQHGPNDADIDPALWSFQADDPQRDIFFVLRLANN